MSMFGSGDRDFMFRVNGINYYIDSYSNQYLADDGFSMDEISEGAYRKAEEEFQILAKFDMTF